MEDSEDLKPLPQTHGFPACPASWFYACAAPQLQRRPLAISVGGRDYVAYRTRAGKPIVLDGRCVHLGAKLSRGTVVGDCLRCPFHEWEFQTDGRCVTIPSTRDIPAFARQTAYPAAELGGHVFFFNRPTASFPLPFFDGVAAAELLPARPFEMTAETPWYLIGSNAFDLQHFNSAHDRTLVGTPEVDTPSPYARRITASFDVTGQSIRDRLTRAFSGPRVKMSITDWAGNFILVTAQFRNTTSYGMVTTQPLGSNRTRVKVIVWVKRGNGVHRKVIDRLDAAVRRSFIRAFVTDDAIRSAGAGYHPGSLIDADRELAGYFTWLKTLSAGPVAGGFPRLSPASEGINT